MGTQWEGYGYLCGTGTPRVLRVQDQVRWYDSVQPSHGMGFLSETQCMMLEYSFFSELVQLYHMQLSFYPRAVKVVGMVVGVLHELEPGPHPGRRATIDSTYSSILKAQARSTHAVHQAAPEYSSALALALACHPTQVDLKHWFSAYTR